MEPKWFENQNNVVKLARWLHSQGTFNDIDAVLRYFSKPWNWCMEWDEMIMDEKADDANTLLASRQCNT